MELLLLALSVLMLPPSYDDGTILFFENLNQPIVEYHTRSTLSHTAILINIDGEPWVYEAFRPVVRRIKLNDLLGEIDRQNKRPAHVGKNRVKVWLSPPGVPYTPDEISKMRKYLDAQLGRDYSIKSYLQGPGPTIHCCELVTNAINATGLIKSSEPWRETPIALWQKTTTTKVILR